MGTRAQFFIGNPSDIENRVYLGTVAWDGYPDGDIGKILKGVTTEESFRNVIKKGIAEEREDYADPETTNFPFPWKDDLYLTDCTYAFFDGVVQFTYYHTGFVPLDKYLAFTDDEISAYSEQEDTLPRDIEAPRSDKPAGPDSIMIITMRE